MSGEGPESIPTSADARSKRPIKKRALTPVSAQAKEVESLFTRPEQEIRIPAAGQHQSRARRIAAPPEIVTNVQGSSAGAGSGEFHVYKASRRREYERLRQMDEEVRNENEAQDFEAAKLERQARDEEKTRKNREKREKKLKARMAKGKFDGVNHIKDSPVSAVATAAAVAVAVAVAASSKTRAEVDPSSDEAPDSSVTLGGHIGGHRVHSESEGGDLKTASNVPGLLIHDDDD